MLHYNKQSVEKRRALIPTLNVRSICMCEEREVPGMVPVETPKVWVGGLDCVGFGWVEGVGRVW